MFSVLSVGGTFLYAICWKQKSIASSPFAKRFRKTVSSSMMKYDKLINDRTNIQYKGKEKGEPMNQEKINIPPSDLKYLQLLSTKYPDMRSASSEIINLQAILNLPKGTEFFLSDIHGEYEAFTHMLKSASGVIRHKVNEVFGNSLIAEERNALITLIYYPEEKLSLIKANGKNQEEWYEITLRRLIKVCRMVSSKYTRSKVRKALPKDFSYIIEELLHEQKAPDKEEYYNQIIKTIMSTDSGDAFILAMCRLIQKLAVDRLHILGDIFDRGPGPELIMDALMDYNVVDFQWGNHDMLWIGAAAGSDACIANVLRIASSYSNLDTIREGYGINLLPLVTFAMDTYQDDPCTLFLPKIKPDEPMDDKEYLLTARMHKAMAIIQFKLEAAIIKRSFPEEMADRLLLDKINLQSGTITLDQKEYPLKDTHFPTLHPDHPDELTRQEWEVVHKLRTSFIRSERLQKHIRFLFAKGSMYKVYNSNLLFHGCILLEEDGSFKQYRFADQLLSGKAYIDALENLVVHTYFDKADVSEKERGLDTMWYLWAGPGSPLYGKNKMATFERYFIAEKETHAETKNPYYRYRDDENTCKRILEEFGLNPDRSHIINGHVPVASKKGENPVKANGRLLVIDGGMSKAYQAKTGTAGYTLIYNSHGLLLVSHEPFESRKKAIEEDKDIVSSTTIIEKVGERKKVADTDTGYKIREEIAYLELLLKAFRRGILKEH